MCVLNVLPELYIYITVESTQSSHLGTDHEWRIPRLYHVCSHFGNTLSFNSSISTTDIYFPRNESKTTRFLDVMSFTILRQD